MSELTEGTYPLDRLWEPKEMPKRIPSTTVSYWGGLRYKGEGPKYLKLSPRKVLYRESDIQDWLASSARTSTVEAA